MTYTTIRLKEHECTALPADALPQEVGECLWSQYGDKVQVEPPSFKTGSQWQLTPRGWVGHLPVREQYRLLIAPKVTLSNIFRMLEYAYRLDFLASGDLIGAQSLQDLFERLAKILSRRVLDRSRKGLYREYVARSGRLPFVRGKVVVESMVGSSCEPMLDCRYHENTADIEENQILAWTLYCIACSGFCREDAGRLVRRAFRATQGIAQLKVCPPQLCGGRHYNRLNEDYQPLHALCRFFLDHGGPSHEKGSHAMLPFLIDMARLYEVFVAEWLRQHLPEWILLQDQAVLRLGDEHHVEFRIDLLLIDRRTGSCLGLLDTKYKTPASPSAGDLEQVIAYAKAVGAREALLVYPQELPKPVEVTVGGDIHVWTTTFALSGDLDQEGNQFLARLLNRLK